MPACSVMTIGEAQLQAERLHMEASPWLESSGVDIKSDQKLQDTYWSAEQGDSLEIVRKVESEKVPVELETTEFAVSSFSHKGALYELGVDSDSREPGGRLQLTTVKHVMYRKKFREELREPDN